MKKNIENSIKKSLEKHEMPYNAAAWTALSAKLDAKMPATSPRSNFKWYAVASTIVVMAVSSYFIIKHNAEKPVNEDAVISQNEVINPVNTPLNNENKNKVEQNKETISEDVADVQNTNTSSTPVINANPANNVNSSNPLTNNSNQVNPNENQANQLILKEGNASRRNDPPVVISESKLSLPTIADLCEGATFTVDNVNDEALVIEGPELYFIVPANAKRTVRTKSAGVHSIQPVNSTTNSPRKEFNVKNTLTADFTIDSETKFEKGLPTTKVSATVPGTNYDWIFNERKISGRDVNAHFYTKGNHSISLIVTGSNGCSSTATKTIYVDEKYNLMAENAFVPTDVDPRNNTFMPFALKERNVKFTLRIYDTRDGHVIFESTDATNGWNGNDMKTGRAVPYEQVYVWKVIIENPEPNEINEYGGSILPMHSK